MTCLRYLVALPFCLIFLYADEVSSGPADAREILTQGASSSNPAHRREVALALGLLSERDPETELLRSLMSDHDVQVRVAAIAAVADLRGTNFIPDLKTALDDDVPEVAFAAAKSLWSLGQPVGKQVLIAVLEGDRKARSNYLRRKYRRMMRSFATPKGAILFAMNHGIGFVPLPGVGAGFSALEALMSESDFSPRASVAIRLAQDNDAETRTALLDALSDDDWSVRAAAAQALGMRNDRRLRNELLPLLRDDSSRVRYRAAASFLRLTEMHNSER